MSFLLRLVADAAFLAWHAAAVGFRVRLVGRWGR